MLYNYAEHCFGPSIASNVYTKCLVYACMARHTVRRRTCTFCIIIIAVANIKISTSMSRAYVICMFVISVAASIDNSLAVLYLHTQNSPAQAAF